MTEDMYWEMTVFMTRKSSVLLPSLDSMILRIAESGLGSYWESRVRKQEMIKSKIELATTRSLVSSFSYSVINYCFVVKYNAKCGCIVLFFCIIGCLAPHGLECSKSCEILQISSGSQRTPGYEAKNDSRRGCFCSIGDWNCL